MPAEASDRYVASALRSARVLDERWRKVGGGVGDAVPGDRCPEQRREIVTVVGQSHAEADRSRIDAAKVQIPEVAQHGRAESDVEARHVVDARGPRRVERRREPIEIGGTVIVRLQAVVIGAPEQRQPFACAAVRPAILVDPERRRQRGIVESVQFAAARPQMWPAGQAPADGHADHRCRCLRPGDRGGTVRRHRLLRRRRLDRLRRTRRQERKGPRISSRLTHANCNGRVVFTPTPSPVRMQSRVGLPEGRTAP